MKKRYRNSNKFSLYNLRVKVVYLTLFCCIVGFQGIAQITVRGTVVDDANVPLTGVNIIKKDAPTTGTITDIDGNYEIDLPNSNDTLIFSYIGYRTEEIAVSGRGILNVTLQTDGTALDEVIVVGYGSQKKGSVTGAVSSISSDVISALPVASFTEAIQGRLPGVLVTNTGGPGQDPIVRIRGIGSITFAPNPLYVVDGYPVGSLADFDNNDIESISVLKDASAAAIYGSRAANGVVLVTTKRGGASTGLRVSYTGYAGVDEAWNKLELLNREQYLQYGMQLLSNAGAAFPERWSNLNQPIYEGATQTYAQTDVDYQDAVFRQALNTGHSIGLSGGNEYSKFYSSFGYFKQEGIIIGTEYERFNARLNSDHTLAKRIKIGQTLTLVSTGRENEKEAGGRTLLQHVIRGVPYIPIEDPTLPGGYRVPDNSDGSDPDNPVKISLLNKNFDKGTRILGTAYAGIDLFKGLEYRFTAGVDWRNSRNKQIFPIFFDGFSGNEDLDLQETNSTFTGTYYSNQLTFQRDFGQHNLDIVAVAERQDSRFDQVTTAGSRPTNDLLVIGGVNNPRITGNLSENTLYSFAGRLNYNYLGRYLFGASIRRDGSSKFAEGKKWGTFPSVSAGWVVSEEPFMAGLPSLSILKIRGSWGKIGFEGIGDYASQVGISNNTSAVFGNTNVRGAFFNRLPNRELEWEITEMTNIGVDLGFFNNRLQFSGEWYQRNTDNLILTVPQPPSQGFSSSTDANVGSIENWGLEFQGVYLSNPRKDFKWDVTLNFGLFRNTVVALATETGTLFAGNVQDFGGTDITRTKAGDPIQAFYGWQVEGIFQSQAQIDEYNARGDSRPYQDNAAPGDLIFKDLDGDGTITPDDRTVLGSFIPDFNYGLRLGADYKNLYLSIFFNGVQGNEIYNATKVLTQGGLRLFNAGVEVLNAWTPQNTNTDIPRMVNGDPNQNTRTSDRFIEDGSFLRLQNLRIGYRFPQGFGSGFVKNMEVYVSGSNLLTFTKYTGYDPEIGFRGAASGANLLRNGIDYGQYPRARNFSFGVRAGF